MRCTHAEKLIPLFAGDDLPAREADALRRHLESCENCRRLAAEFEESRDWLRGFPAPQFDEAMLDGMRDSVLRDIGRIENRAQWLQWIVPGWDLRFAASVAVLLLILLATYAYRGRRPQTTPDKENVVKINPGGDQKHSAGDAQRNDEIVNPSPVPAQRPPLKRMRRINGNRGVKPVRLPDLAVVNAPIVPPIINIGPVFEPPPLGADMAMDDAIFNREMTRIEFQTADPNIRIIWLTPKDSDSSSTKSNTKHSIIGGDNETEINCASIFSLAGLRNADALHIRAINRRTEGRTEEGRTDPAPQPQRLAVKLFEIKHRSRNSLANSVKPLGSGAGNATIYANEDLKTVTVRDFPENIAAIEEALKRLDVPDEIQPPQPTAKPVNSSFI